MTGGAERVPTLTTPPPPASVPRLKHTPWYMSDRYICLQYLLFLSLIFCLCWLWRNRELVWDIVRGKFAKQLHSGSSLIRIVSSTTPGSVSLVHGFTHDKNDLFGFLFRRLLWRHCKTFNINAQKPKFYSSTVVYFTLADLLGNQ